MKLYWSYNSIPELAGLPEEKKKEIWKKCHRHIWRHWQIWLAFLVLWIFLTSGGILVEKFDSIFWKWLCLFFVCFIGGQIFSQVMASVARSHIPDYLSSNEKTKQQ